MNLESSKCNLESSKWNLESTKWNLESTKWISKFNEKEKNLNNNQTLQSNQNNWNNNWNKYKKIHNTQNKDFINKQNKKFNSFQYSQNNNLINNRYSAGILPYTYDLNGNCLILLGKDIEGNWSDFGGRCELKDNNNEIHTAAREFYEETLGSIISINECIDKININTNKIISKTLNGSPYYMFVVYIDYDNYYDCFYKTLNFMKYHFSYEKHNFNKIIEKNNIRWFNINTIFNYIIPNIIKKNNNYYNSSMNHINFFQQTSIENIQNNNENNTNNFIFPLRNVFLNTIIDSKEQLFYIVK